MSTDIVKYAFIAGEISPSLYGRTDLTKYDLALAEAKNFFVDFRGGLSSRPGTQFIHKTKNVGQKPRLFTFSFAPDVANGYVIEFGNLYARFIQDGAIVTLAGVPYEIVTPFTTADLDGLKVEQYRDLLRITSGTFPTYNLIRHDHTNWQLALENTAEFVAGVNIIGSSASAAGTAQVVFAITKVLADGTESVIGPPTKVFNIVNYTATEGSVSVTWSPASDAAYYNVYRSIVSSAEHLLEGTALGYVGRAHGTKFTDPNMIPDFTRVPPSFLNPFAPGSIEKIDISNNGFGYTPFASSIAIADPTGTGFAGQVITSDSGEIVNVIIINGGTGYTAPVVSFGGGGAGAVATAEVRPLTGTYPTVSVNYNQRQLYAASINDPVTLWGSRIKQFSNFSASDFVLDDDSFDFTLDTPAITPIEHIIVTRGGLLCMTQKDIWLLNGGGLGEPITPINALAEPQSFAGASPLRPIKLGNDILYAEGEGHAVLMLTYNEIYRSYTSDDKSLLSSHLFGPGRDIIRWAYQRSPYKVVWAVREDGALLAFTSVKAEEVFAWTPGDTKGQFVDLVSLQEGTEDRIYVTVYRKVNGVWDYFIERLDLRQFTNVEDAWCVDCGLSLTPRYPTGTLTFAHVDDVWTATTSIANIISVGDFIRGANGIFKVLSRDGLVYTCDMYAEPTNWIPQTGDSQSFPIAQGDWTADTPVGTLSGLGHLEGETVSILADGNVFPQQQVVGGSVTLPHKVTRAIIGLPFTCQAKTLPLVIPNTNSESKRKRIVGIGVRVDKSRGIQIGPSLDRMRPMRERTDELPGRPIKLINGMKYQLLHTEWNEDGQTYFVQEDPLPCNILSIVSDIEVGDEPD